MLYCEQPAHNHSDRPPARGTRVQGRDEGSKGVPANHGGTLWDVQTEEGLERWAREVGLGDSAVVSESWEI